MRAFSRVPVWPILTVRLRPSRTFTSNSPRMTCGRRKLRTSKGTTLLRYGLKNGIELKAEAIEGLDMVVRQFDGAAYVDVRERARSMLELLQVKPAAGAKALVRRIAPITAQ